MYKALSKYEKSRLISRIEHESGQYITLTVKVNIFIPSPFRNKGNLSPIKTLLNLNCILPEKIISAMRDISVQELSNFISRGSSLIF